MMKQILPICLFLLLMTGCKERPEVSATLDRAEELMESAPDSALTLLQTLDTETFLKRSTHARHALLYTQAQDKNYIDETNDSLINIAVDHYRHHGDMRSRFLSLYYKGRVLVNSENHLKAMRLFLEAEMYVSEVKDDYYTGLLYTQMGNEYNEFYDFTKSYESYKKASDYYHAASKELHYLFALVDQSTACRNLNEYARSDSLLQKVCTEAKRIDNHSLAEYASVDLFMQYIEQGRTKEARIIYDELETNFGIEDNTVSFMKSVINLHLSENNISKAETVLQKSWLKAMNADDSISCHFAASQIFEAKGQYDKALQEQTAGVLIQNHIVGKNLKHPVLTMQRNSLHQELEHEAYKRKSDRLIYILTMSIVGVLFLGGVNLLMKNLRKHYQRSLHHRLQRQADENKCEIERIWRESRQREDKIRQNLMELNKEAKQKNDSSLQRIFLLQEEVRLRDNAFQLYRQQSMELITALEKDKQHQRRQNLLSCRTYFKTIEKIYCIYNGNYYNEKARTTAINEMLIMFVDKYTKNTKAYAVLEQEVNDNMDNVMFHLRNELALPEQEYYQQMCFFFAGFSGDSIASIMNITPNTVYKRKKRIIEKINKDFPIHKELFINLLSK